MIWLWCVGLGVKLWAGVSFALDWGHSLQHCWVAFTLCVCIMFASLFEDFGASGEHVEIVESEEFVGDPAFGTATTQIHKVCS